MGEGNLKRMTWVGKQAAEQWAKADDATKAKYEAQRGAEKHAEAVKAYEESGRKAEYEKANKEAIKARKEEEEQEDGQEEDKQEEDDHEEGRQEEGRFRR